jgi:hypothetical protein
MLKPNISFYIYIKSSLKVKHEYITKLYNRTNEMYFSEFYL